MQRTDDESIGSWRDRSDVFGIGHHEGLLDEIKKQQHTQSDWQDAWHPYIRIEMSYFRPWRSVPPRMAASVIPHRRWSSLAGTSKATWSGSKMFV